MSSSKPERYNRALLSEKIGLCSDDSPKTSPESVISDESPPYKSVSSTSPISTSDLSNRYGSECSKITCSSRSDDITCASGGTTELSEFHVTKSTSQASSLQNMTGNSESNETEWYTQKQRSHITTGDGSPVLDSPTEYLEARKGERSASENSTKSGTSLYVSLSSEGSPHPPNELSATKSEVGSNLSPTSPDQDPQDNSEAEESEEELSTHTCSSVQSGESETGEEEEEGEEENGQGSSFIDHSTADMSSDSNQSEGEEGRCADREEEDGAGVAKSFATYRDHVTPLSHFSVSSEKDDDQSSPSPKLTPPKDNSSLSNVCDAITPMLTPPESSSRKDILSPSSSCTLPQDSANSCKHVSPDSNPSPPVILVDSKHKPLPNPKLLGMTTDEPIVISPDVHIPPPQQQLYKPESAEASGHSGDGEGREDGEGCATGGGGSAVGSSDKDGDKVKDVVLVEDKESFKPEPQFKVGYQYRSVVKQLMETQVR